jgi:flagellar basal-body rod protein FlgG
MEIDSKGTVSVDGNRIATLAIVDFPKPYQLQKSGSSLLIPSEEGVAEQPAKNVAVRQGAVEQSNVNPMLEMAQLIDSNRNYESCIKVVQNYDSIASKAANDLGKV